MSVAAAQTKAFFPDGIKNLVRKNILQNRVFMCKSDVICLLRYLINSVYKNISAETL